MPTTSPHEASTGPAVTPYPRASDAMRVLVQNYAIAYAHGRDDIATEIERAIALRLSRLTMLATFGRMSPSTRRIMLDCVLGDIRAEPQS